MTKETAAPTLREAMAKAHTHVFDLQSNWHKIGKVGKVHCRVATGPSTSPAAMYGIIMPSFARRALRNCVAAAGRCNDALG